MIKTTTAKKAAKAQVKKAVTAKKPLEKTVVQPVSNTRGVAAAKKNTVTRLTKEMLAKRQASKGSVRKQGGAKIAELSPKKLTSLSRSVQMEAGPTKAE